MLGIEKQSFIRKRVMAHAPGSRERIFWSLHAIGKLRREKMKKIAVEEALRKCIIIEDYPMEGIPLPGCLVLGHIGRDAIHAVIAIDEDNERIFVITVYKPSAERWEDGWKKRK